MITASAHRILFLFISALLFSILFASGAKAKPPWSASASVDESQLFCLADNCTKCHDNVFALVETESEDTLYEEVDISFGRTWGTTMMRFSFLDPFWRAKVRSESLTLPGLVEAIETKCSRCHAPMANAQAKADGKTIHIFNDEGFVHPGNEYHDLAMQGVGCVLCHQIMDPEVDITDDPLPISYPNSGDFEISPKRVAWSKYYPDFVPAMFNSSKFIPEFAEHPTKSAFCATCHDLYTDYFNENGGIESNEETRFPEQTPYQEWLASDFSKGDSPTHCQDCHMTMFDESIIASTPNGTIPRGNVYQHTFLTENTMMLNAIASLAEAQGITVPDLDDAILAGQDYLTTAGTIEVTDISWSNGELIVQVKISNMAGHKLPTSIPVRRVFIHFAVYAGDTIDPSQLLFSSGDTNEDGGIIGVDDVLQELGYEPHYTMITSEDQVQVYEGIMQTTDGDVTTTLLRAASFVKDNRILPVGWAPSEAQMILSPAGAALEDADFVGGEDIIEYRIKSLGLSAGETATIEVELKDQTLSYPMAQALVPFKDQDETGMVATFLDEYEHHKVHFEIINNDVVTFERPNSSN